MDFQRLPTAPHSCHQVTAISQMAMPIGQFIRITTNSMAMHRSRRLILLLENNRAILISRESSKPSSIKILQFEV